MNPWKKLISSWLRSLGLTALAVFAGLLIGKRYIALANIAVKSSRIAWFQFIGVAVVLLATLAFISCEIQTRGGASTPEKVNNWAFRILYVIGSVFLILT